VVLGASFHSDVRAEDIGRTYSLENKFGISVSVSPQAGTYSILCAGKRWLGEGLVSVLVDGRWYRSAAYPFVDGGEKKPSSGRLQAADVKTGSENDVLGVFDFIEVRWKVPSTALEIVTGFRLYRDNPYLAFVQRFPGGFKNYANGDWTVPSVSFPQFAPHIQERLDLSLWTSGGMFTHRFGYGDASSLAGTIDFLVLSDEDSRTLVLSPFSNYLVATQQSSPATTRNMLSNRVINCGIEGLVAEIPAGFEHQHLLVFGQGTHTTIQAWGQALLRRSGKKVPSKYADDSLKYPVYFDDAGAYYYDHGFKEKGYASYEDIVLALDGEARRNGLRLGAYHVMDDAQQRAHEGVFEPRADLFPHGLASLHEKLGRPLLFYFRWLNPNGPYRQKYAYFETEKGEVPTFSMGDVFYTEDFWRSLADKLASWGGISLQHDFLSAYEGDKVMMAGLKRMDTYMKNMARALQEKGMLMQYCMQLPRNVMESTENPIMFSLQGSHDHHVEMATNPHQITEQFVWKHLIFSSAFYGAVGIWPSRDNMQTVADPNAFEDVLLANLLGGQIQLGHRLGECDFDLLRKTYREGDGLILKPDRPIVPLDRCYQEGCAVGYSESTISGKKWLYVLSLPSAGYLPSFSLSDLGIIEPAVVFRFGTNSLSVKAPTAALPLRQDTKHEYFVVAPILNNGMAVVGDADKFVTMADMRIASVDTTNRTLTVGVLANQDKSPIIAGYSSVCPRQVKVANTDLPQVASHRQLQQARAGWAWDEQSKLWWVKVDFSGASSFESRSFTID
jgi:hypothetical protein